MTDKKSSNTPPQKKPTPNHMDKSDTFSYKDADGKKANDIKNFPATSRYIPTAKNEEHRQKQLKIEANNKRKLDALKKDHNGKKWIEKKGKEKEVTTQKAKEQKTYEQNKKDIIAKNQAKSKETYAKSKDALSSKFKKKAVPSKKDINVKTK